MPLVTVVIPIYNGERFLAKSIESVRSQTLHDWELVIVNDGSRDGSLAIAASYQEQEPRIRIVSQPNSGVATARNRGAAEADRTSRYLLFLDQDDVLESEALAILAQALDADPQAAGAHGYSHDIDAHGAPLTTPTANFLHVRLGLRGRRVLPWPIDAPTTFAVVAVRCPFPSTGVVLLRRSAFERTGGFDSYVVPADDYDMWIRLASQRHIIFVPETVLHYRWHEGNVSHHSEAVGRGAERCWRKHLGSTHLSLDQRRILWRGYQYSRLWVCRARWQWAVEHIQRRDAVSALKQIRHLPGDWLRFIASLVRYVPSLPVHHR